MAVVPVDAIDGKFGLTITSVGTCVFDQSINEADVMVAASWYTDGTDTVTMVMDFGWPDEPWIPSGFPCQGQPLSAQTGRCSIGLGDFTFLHEFGHTIGLNHAAGQVVMHNGPPVPLGGGGGGRIDPAALFPDDVAGARFFYGGNSFRM